MVHSRDLSKACYEYTNDLGVVAESEAKNRFSRDNDMFSQIIFWLHQRGMSASW